MSQTQMKEKKTTFEQRSSGHFGTCKGLRKQRTWVLQKNTTAKIKMRTQGHSLVGRSLAQRAQSPGFSLRLHIHLGDACMDPGAQEVEMGNKNLRVILPIEFKVSLGHMKPCGGGHVE